MTTKQRFSLLSKPIAYNRYFVNLAGTTDAALLLSQAVYWSERTSHPRGWFFKTQRDWEEETGLTRSQQECARKRLRMKSFWQESLRGNPARLYFRIDCRILQTCLLEIGKLECENLQTSMQESASSLKTEITTKITTEQKKRAAAAFSAIGFSKPFGHSPFQEIWLRHFEAAQEEKAWLTGAMENAIQECQDEGISIPPPFYSAKRSVEESENRAFANGERRN